MERSAAAKVNYRFVVVLCLFVLFVYSRTNCLFICFLCLLFVCFVCFAGIALVKRCQLSFRSLASVRPSLPSFRHAY